ncbi:MAG: thioredoxin domain-containing protein [Rhodospirillaceae bacterium]
MATIELTKDNFEQVVMSNDLVLVDFRAPWCGRAPRLVSRRPACGSGAAGAAVGSLERSE